MLTRKDFNAIAKVIKDNTDGKYTSDDLDNNTISQGYRIAKELANICEQHNPRFNRKRFANACGFYEL